MTKKDYELIAGAICEAQKWAGTEQKSGVILTAQYVADRLQKENTRFDKNKFMQACGVLGW